MNQVSGDQPMQTDDSNNPQITNRHVYDYSNQAQNNYYNPYPDGNGYTGGMLKGGMRKLGNVDFGRLASPIGLFIVLQLVVIILLIVLINPKRAYDSYKQNRVVDRAEELAKVDSEQKPVVAIVSDADKLRGADPVQQAVYKDAKNGDYVLAYTDTLIIYRKDNDKVIYSGDNPRVLLTKNQEQLVKDLSKVVVDAGLVTEEQAKNPQLLAVTDSAKLRKQDPEFFELAKENDLIAYYPDAEKVVLFRPSEKKILTSGVYKTQITPQK